MKWFYANLENYQTLIIVIVFQHKLPNRVPAGVVRLKAYLSLTL